MTKSMRALSVGCFVPMLRTLGELLEKGEAHAAAKGYEPQVLADSRLAPDMFPLWFQVQFAIYLARSGVDRLTGREPADIDREAPRGVADLKAQLAEAVAALEAVSGAAFEGAADRRISFPLQGGAYFEADALGALTGWYLPQFYFHVATAYDILRHNGVELGKRDFMGQTAGPHIRMGQPEPA